MTTDLAREVVDAVREAGRAVEEVRRQGFDVEQKEGQGPVTRADRGADDLLRERLTGLRDGAWLSEESADDPAREKAERLWIVDPLDGTKEFVEGVPQYSVAVALVERGRIVLGVVHNPATAETFHAVRGEGAFLDGERIRVRESEVLLASRTELSRGEFDPFREEWTVRPTGSTQYKLALVAAGEGGATFSRGPKWEWDVCAGELLVREAGGRCTELPGTDLEYNKPFPKVRGMLAGAPEAHERARSRLEDVGPAERMREDFPEL
ncbi:MAG: 3'(2'),5'-bisphosphate nucleotidase CysQ [Candidatus Palauibacterales bacterium]|nr:3'(2'),5'-bisphosphate nucleotidase CysQ [Candidatus Palauibacterales bacterium]